MNFPLLRDVVIILGLSLVILFLFKRFRLPNVLGFIVAGIVGGPYGLSLIKEVHDVEVLSELGIIFLLFIIGIELSLKTLSSIKKAVFLGGGLQVLFTVMVVGLLAMALRMPVEKSIFIGFLFSLSSTAIVLKILLERGELSTHHGRVIVGILIFQDIIVVPMMLISPFLAGQVTNVIPSVGVLIIKLTVLFSAIILAARYIFPYILYRLIKSGSRELFYLAVVLLCFGSAWLTDRLGLSLALGAFFAGLIISESDYSHEATSFVLPFREIFLSFFFVSIGMLLDIPFFIQHLPVILLLTVITFFLKGLMAAIATIFIKLPAISVFLVGLALFQVGEFAFVLSKIGLTYQLITAEQYQYFLAVSLLTMGLTPWVINYAYPLINMIKKSPISPLLSGIDYMTKRRKNKQLETPLQELKDHLVIIGYGLNGKNVAKAARKSGIQYIALEHDPQVYHHEKKYEPNLIFGNAEDEHVLRHLLVYTARVIVIAIADTQATKVIIRQIRTMTHTAEIIVRTRYIKDIENFLKLGADEVIPEEFETSIEIFTRVLRKYLIPELEIELFSAGIREKNYDVFRSEQSRNKPGKSFSIPDMEITTLQVEQGDNSIVGKTVAEAALKDQFGIRVLAIKRQDMYITRITKDIRIQQDDIVYLFGRPEEIIKLNQFLGVKSFH